MKKTRPYHTVPAHIANFLAAHYSAGLSRRIVQHYEYFGRLPNNFGPYTVQNDYASFMFERAKEAALSAGDFSPA